MTLFLCNHCVVFETLCKCEFLTKFPLKNNNCNLFRECLIKHYRFGLQNVHFISKCARLKARNVLFKVKMLLQ